MHLLFLEDLTVTRNQKPSCWSETMSVVLTLLGLVVVSFWKNKNRNRKGQSETEPVHQNLELLFNYSQAFGFKTSEVTTPVPVTCLTVSITMRMFSGLGSRTAVGFFLHLGQLLSTCVSCLLVASMDTRSAGTVNWSVFLWCICFSGTLTIFMVELCGLQSHFPSTCYDLL